MMKKFMTSTLLTLTLLGGLTGASTAQTTQPSQTGEQLKAKYDTNGDGVLDEKEKAAARQDLIKRYDTNGDGQLSDAEKEQARKTVREALQRRRGQGNTRR